jgi:rhodanese-related sulfurtransferase
MIRTSAFVLLAALTAAPAIARLDAQAPSQAASPAAAPAPATAVAAPAFKAKVLKRAELDALLAQPDRVLVLDVRRPDELQSIGGFPVFLSIQSGDLEQRKAFIPKDRVIVTVSNHASRAGRAADLLTNHGFTVAGAIGAQDYEAEGGTLVKIAPRAPAAAGAATAATPAPATAQAR